MPVQPPRWWEWFYLFFPVLIQESTSIAPTLQLWKFGFRTLLVLKDAFTTSTTVKTLFFLSSHRWNRSLQASKKLYRCGNWILRHSWLWKTPVQPAWWWQWLYLIFPALKQESTSIAQPLQLWKLGFRTFLVLKDACTTSTTLEMALSDIPSAETWVHKHERTSKVVEIEL